MLMWPLQFYRSRPGWRSGCHHRSLAWIRGLIRHRTYGLVTTTMLDRNSVWIVNKNHVVCMCVVPYIEGVTCDVTGLIYVFHLILDMHYA
jgi:hypothetical protein